MRDERTTEKAIFNLASNIESTNVRNEYLGQVCGADAELRGRVATLLRMQAEDPGFLEAPAAGIAATLDKPASGGQLGALIGPYKLLEQIGEGGMGVVYMAEQQQPVRRLVALKLVKPGMNSNQVIARFEAERQALAMMDHPNIARILDAGTVGARKDEGGRMKDEGQTTNSSFSPHPSAFESAGRPFFVMELVRGVPINEFCDQQKLIVRERLELFIQVCQAVQHAHQKGIIHRDLKPTNVLVTKADTAPLPKVIDFGIAKALGPALTDHTLHTGFAQLVGTPMYMSPEQAELNHLGVDTRSDIYSLGVLLYELLTGTTPFDKERLKSVTFDEMRRIIREEEPETVSARLARTRKSGVRGLGSGDRGQEFQPHPSSFRLHPFEELDWIVMKALEKDRSRRYESASALAADIQRYLSDEPVLACPPTAMYRFQKFARKHKPALATAAAIALCLILGTTVSAWQAARATTAEAQAIVNEQQANTQRDEAEKQRDEVKSMANRLQQTLYAAHINLAQQSWNENDIVRAFSFLKLYRPKPGESDPRGFEWHYLHRLCRGDKPVTIYVTGGRTFSDLDGAIFSPDGKRVVTNHASSGNSGDPESWTKPELRVWDVQTGQRLFSLTDHTVYINRYIYSPDGKQLATTSGDGTIKVWDAKTCRQLLNIKGHSAYVNSVAYSPDSKRLASGADGVKVWDSQTGQELLSLAVSGRSAREVAFSPDGKRLAAGNPGPRVGPYELSVGEVKVWDAQTGKEILSLKGGGDRVAFSPDGRRLASLSDNHAAQRKPGELKVWDAQTGAELTALNEQSDGWMDFAFSPDSKRLAVSGLRARAWRIKVCDAETGREQFTLQRHTNQICAVAFSPDSAHLASSARDGTVRIWDLTTGAESRTLHEEGSGFCTVAFSPDGQRVLLARDDKVHICNVKNADEPAAMKGRLHSVAYSPDGKRVAGGEYRFNKMDTLVPVVKIWDPHTGKELLTLRGHTESIRGLAFSPDGKRLASTSFDPSAEMRTVKVWNSETGQELFSLAGGGSYVAFSPDGKRLAAGYVGRMDDSVKIWNPETGAELQSLALARDPARPPIMLGGPVAFSPDGKRIGRAAKVWDVETGAELLTLPSGSMLMAFSPDGRRLAGIGRPAGINAGRELKVWDAQSGDELQTMNDQAYFATFSPDGTRVVTVSGSQNAVAAGSQIVKMWDSQSGQELLTLKGANRVAFSPNGHRLVGASDDGLIIWDATPLPEKP